MMAKAKRVAARKRGGRPEVSLVVPARGAEVLLGRTLECAAEGAGGVRVELIVVDNGIDLGCLDADLVARLGARVVSPDRAGTGRARHCGMLAAGAEVVVTIDAHVRLAPGWAGAVLGAFEADPDRLAGVSCGHVGGLSAEFEPEGPCGYHGARLMWMDSSAEPRPVVAKWIRLGQAKGDRVGAPMGAFYALARGWYDAMHQPWRLMTSWGCDEESVTLATACLGGSVRMLPAECQAWHRFGASAVRYEHGELRQIWANRRNLLHLFPFSAEEVAALSSFAGYSGELPMEFFADQDFTAFRDAFGDCRGRLVEYLMEWCEGYPEWMAELSARGAAARRRAEASRVAAAQRVVAPPQRLPPRQHDVCAQCDGVDTFVVTDTEANLRRYKCKRCGRRAWRPRESGELQFSVVN